MKSKSQDKSLRKKDWNPATFFIWIFLLIGSQSIQLIATRHDFADYSRRTQTKIAVLREVVERLKKGEEVDVKAMLGTGKREEEKEWEEILKEIEEEDKAFHRRKEEAGEGRGVAEEELVKKEEEEAVEKDAKVEGKEKDWNKGEFL